MGCRRPREPLRALLAGCLLAAAGAGGCAAAPGALPSGGGSPRPSLLSAPAPAGELRLVALDRWDRAAGSFLAPEGLSTDFSGLLYAADPGTNRVVQLDARGVVRRTVGAAGAQPRRFIRPVDVCCTLSFNLLVSDAENERVQVFDHLGNFAGTIPPAGEFPAGSPDGLLSHPWGLDLGADGRLYVADHEDHRVVVFDASGRMVATLGSMGAGAAQLSGPTGLAVDRDRLYVADTGNARIQRFLVDGTWLGSWNGGPREEDRLRRPLGVAVGSAGELFVCDEARGEVVAFDANGRVIARAGAGAGEADGPRAPRGVTAGPDARLYVSDGSEGRIFVYRVEYAPVPASDEAGGG